MAWLVVVALYVSCWFLPIHDGHINIDIGYDGAEFAHKEFWRLLTGETNLETGGPFPNRYLGEVFGAVFISIGWLANELFVAGVVALWKWPHIAVRLFAFSLGVMISWQVAFPEEFPFLVGYWFWVVAGGIALWLTAIRLADARQTNIHAVLSDRITLALLLVPVLNATIGLSLGYFENQDPLRVTAQLIGAG